MKETEQTLFLKSNLLHIRLKEGIFEVVDYRCAKLKELPCAGEGIEWPYGVELINQQRLKSIGAWGNIGHFSIPDSDKNEFEFRTVARLLPEEKKSESAYKEGERKSYNYVIDKLIIEKECKAFAAWIMNTPIQGRTLGKLWIDYKQLPVSAPSESQEELLAEILGNWQDFISDPDNNSDFSSAKQQFMKAELEKFTIIETDKELSYDKIRSEYLNHRGRIWTKEEVMLKWIIENYKLITRNP